VIRPMATALTSALVLVATLLLAVPAAATGAPAAATVDLIVALRPSAEPTGAGDLVAAADLVDEQVFDDTRRTISVPAAAADKIAARLAADPRVAYVEEDAEARIVATPADPFYSQQWGMRRVQVPGVWDLTTGSNDVTIAVIDTGVNPAHPDLSGVTYVAGYDFVNGDSTPDDDHGHGTAATGVISAQHNSIGTAGVCPRCRIMPLKSMDADGTGSHNAIASAIHHAVDHGADIINLSLGSEASTNTLQTAVRRAQAAGILVVAAAGNAGVTTPFYPAAYPEALGIAASDSGDGRYSWSNYGSWVSVSAPGCNITPGYAPDTNTLGYLDFCGTSSAAPVTAGVAGLLASIRPGSLGPALTTALQTSALPRSFVAFGRIDATAALAALPLTDTNPDDDGGSTDGGDDGVLPPEDDTAPAEEPVPDEPAETATTVTPSSTMIAYGFGVEIAGRVSSSAGPAEGAMVTLLTRPAGTSEWSTIAEQPTDSTGAVLFTYEPQQNADYRLRFDGTSEHATSLSDAVTIRVRPVVTSRTPRPVLLAGKPAVVAGRLQPEQRGLDLVLQRKTANGWRKVAVGVTGKAGRYRLTVPARVGRSSYRVKVPKTITLSRGTSARVTSVGERTKIVRVRPDAPGDDSRNLNGEFIVVRNTGKTPIQLRGWTVRSASTKTRFALPTYRLPVGARVKIHSGKGRSGKGHVYLNAGREVWRNRRDIAAVRHPTGPVASRVSW
jgi:subtilisin family serine protease